MRSISGTLEAAQKVAPLINYATQFGAPRILVEIFNKRAGITLLKWTRYYEGAEGDYFHACCMPGDGSLIRFRADSITDHRMYQRVTNPGVASDYSSWADWGESIGAVAACSYGAKVFLFWIELIGGHLWRRESSDNGASFAASVDMGDVTGDATFRLAACFKDATHAVVLYSNGTTTYRRRWSGNGWEAAAAWSNSLNSITGLAVTYIGDWNVAVTGIDTSSQDGVWTCVLGDGYGAAEDTWSALAVLMLRESTEDFEYHFPSINHPDVFRLFFVEKYTATQTQNRIYWSHALATAEFVSNLWLEPVPFRHSCNYGMALTYKGTDRWLTTPDGVWYADGQLTEWDVTNDVVELRWRETPKTYRTKVVIVLDNTAGTYNAFDKLGHEVKVSLGYHTAVGDEYSTGPSCWITSYKFVSPPWFPLRAFWPQGVIGTIHIEAETGWDILRRWKARRRFEWAAEDKNIFQILDFIMARVGLEFSSFSASSAAISFKPEFAIPEGYSGWWAVRKILSWVEDEIVQRGEYMYLVHPQSDDESDYSYNSTYGASHLLYRGHYGTGLHDPNRAQVWGDTFMVEDFDFDEIEKTYDKLSRVTKPDYPNATRAAERAERELRHGEIWKGGDGWVQVTTSCGQEMFDVITLDDVAAGVTGIERRILGIYTHYNKRSRAYNQVFLLGKV